MTTWLLAYCGGPGAAAGPYTATLTVPDGASNTASLPLTVMVGEG